MTAPWCNELPNYALVVESGQRRVAMLCDLAKEYGKIEAKDKASLRKWMEIWCADVEGAIPDTRMKAQDRFTGPRGATVLIIAFKSYQARAYGFIRKIAGKETFLVTAVDPKKKDDNANARVLNKAQEEAFKVLAELSK